MLFLQGSEPETRCHREASGGTASLGRWSTYDRPIYPELWQILLMLNIHSTLNSCLTSNSTLSRLVCKKILSVGLMRVKFLTVWKLAPSYIQQTGYPGSRTSVRIKQFIKFLYEYFKSVVILRGDAQILTIATLSCLMDRFKM